MLAAPPGTEAAVFKSHTASVLTVMFVVATVLVGTGVMDAKGSSRLGFVVFGVVAAAIFGTLAWRREWNGSRRAARRS